MGNSRQPAEIFDFLAKLREQRISYRLSDPTDALMVEVAVPGERWEVEFHRDGEIGVEVFTSRRGVEGAETIDELFQRFSDGPDS